MTKQTQDFVLAMLKEGREWVKLLLPPLTKFVFVPFAFGLHMKRPKYFQKIVDKIKGDSKDGS